MSANFLASIERFVAIADQGSPDERKRLFGLSIAPVLNCLPESEKALHGLAMACCDTWSVIRKEARSACAAAANSPQTTSTAIVAFLDALETRAATSVTWFTAEGAILAAQHVCKSRAQQSDVAAALVRFAADVVLPACRHEQLPVRDAAVSFIVAFQIPSTLARIPLVVVDFLTTNVTSASRQGALSLSVAFESARLAAADYLPELAGSADASVRQLTADVLSAANVASEGSVWSSASFASMAVDFVLAPYDTVVQHQWWTRVETGLLALDRICSKAIADANQAGTDALSTPQAASPVIRVNVQTAIKKPQLLSRVAALCNSDQFELRRMASQLLPMLLQLHVRHLHEFDTIPEDLLDALTQPNCALWTGKFCVYRIVLDGLEGGNSGHSSPTAPHGAHSVLVQILQRCVAQNAVVKVLNYVYSIVSLIQQFDEKAERAPAPSDDEWDASEQHVAWAFLDLCRLDPVAALDVAPAISRCLVTAPAHCQATLLAALDALVSAAEPAAQFADVAMQSTTVLTPAGHGQLARLPSLSAHVIHQPAQTGSVAASVFYFVHHPDFAAPDIKDGGSDVLSGIDWIRNSRRTTHIHGAVSSILTSLIAQRQTSFDSIVSRVSQIVTSKSTDTRVFARARHFIRASFRCGVIEPTHVAEVAIARLSAVLPNWRDILKNAAVGSSTAATASTDDWDDDDDDDDDDGSLAVSAREEIECAARLIAVVRFVPEAVALIENANAMQLLLAANATSNFPTPTKTHNSQ